MAEQIAQDPAFAQMTKTLQESMAGMVNPGMPGGAGGGVPAADSAGANAGAAPDPAISAASFDPSKYMDAMTNVLQNPQFMQMAEKLGQQIMQVGSIASCEHCTEISLRKPVPRALHFCAISS
jgi:hypothetical protein